ncbi:hypothetical protein GCM10027048_13210 [Hymenobacter coalescens]
MRVAGPADGVRAAASVHPDGVGHPFFAPAAPEPRNGMGIHQTDGAPESPVLLAMARFFTRQRLLHILVHLACWVALPFLPWVLL